MTILGLLALTVAAMPVAAAAPLIKAKIQGSTLLVTGSSSPDVIALRLAAGDTSTLEIDAGDDGLAEFRFKRNRFDRIEVKAGAGGDIVRIDQSNGGFTQEEQTTLNGEAGDDTLVGGIGPETLVGGLDRDTIDGNVGNDLIQAGAGDDTIIWDPGDASDTIDGAAGNDTLKFNGANIGETFQAGPASGGRVVFTRNIATVSLDLGTVERLELRTLGGADSVTLGDLAGTALAMVAVDLAGPNGGGDAVADTVTYGGSAADDIVDVSAAAGGSVTATRAGTAAVTVQGAEAGVDSLFVDGAAGSDHVAIHGTTGHDELQAIASGTLVSVVGGPLGNARMDTADEFVDILGGDGSDAISAVGALAGLTHLTLDGGAGEDTIFGGNGADTILGGADDDFLDGNQGIDLIDGGAGDDRVGWDPGDASDTIDGGPGSDSLWFHGSNIGEAFQVGAKPDGRVVFTRNIATIALDLGAIERIDLAAFGGPDTLTVDGLAGTGLAQINVDLSAAGNGGAGDSAADTVTINGSAADDILAATGGNGAIELALAGGATVWVNGAEAATDVLTVNGQAGSDRVVVNGTAGPDTIQVVANGLLPSIVGDHLGNVRLDATVELVEVNGQDGADAISAVGNVAALTTLVFDGGPGPDTVLGGNGVDTLRGGAGDDALDGGQGADAIVGGEDDDTVNWDPGDSSDIVDGGTGADRLRFNGSNIAEIFQASASSGHVLFTRNIATVALDLDAIETIDLRTFGGADTVTLDDLAGTDVDDVIVDLRASLGGGDGSADIVNVNGTAADDVFDIVATGSGVEAARTGGATTRIFFSEAALDTLALNGGAGSDTFNVGAGVDAFLQLLLND